jgi:hypothetical protein
MSADVLDGWSQMEQGHGSMEQIDQWEQADPWTNALAQLLAQWYLLVGNSRHCTCY